MTKTNTTPLLVRGISPAVLKVLQVKGKKLSAPLSLKIRSLIYSVMTMTDDEFETLVKNQASAEAMEKIK